MKSEEQSSKGSKTETTSNLIRFTQYLRPNGTPRDAGIKRPAHIVKKAQEIINAGYHLECEVLQDGQVSFAIADREEEVDLAIEVCNNGPEVPDAVDRLIMNFVVPGER